jgi:hypothetical protein
MSAVQIQGNASGTGTLTIAAPNTNTNQTLTLPDQTGTLLTGSGAIGVNASTPTSSLNLDASGNVGIGTSSPSSRFEVANNSTNAEAKISTTQNVYSSLYLNTWALDRAQLRAEAANPGAGSGTGSGILSFLTAGNPTMTERMRIDSSGNLLVGTTDAGGTSGPGFKLTYSATVPALASVVNTATNSNNYLLYNTNATNNGYRFYVNTNGGIYNYSANNSNLSDERTKTDIQNSGNYLAKICAIPVRTFKYKDQSDNLLSLGVIAQEVEVVAPELVDVSGFGETPDDGIPLKAIYQTDLQYALMKCIQEQQALITQLQADVAALKGAV